MKLFVYKTIFVLIGIYILYQVTIGIKIGDYEKKIKNLTNDQGREMIRNKVRNELKKARQSRAPRNNTTRTLWWVDHMIRFDTNSKEFERSRKNREKRAMSRRQELA